MMEAKLKHLDYPGRDRPYGDKLLLVQGLGAVTLAAGLSAFAAVNTRAALLLSIALISTAMFWALDGYYLWLERGFVELHKQVAAKAEADIDFSMVIDKEHAARRWLKTRARPHLCLIYGAIIVIDVIGIVVIRSK